MNTLVTPETTFVAFPYSSNVWSSPEDYLPHPALSQMSRFCLDATIALYRRDLEQNDGANPRLLIMGETGYQDLPSTVDLMAIEVGKQLGDLGGNVTEMRRVNFDDGDLLNNTIRQVKGIGNYMEIHPGKVIAVALRYHIPRIESNARSLGVELELRAAEDILTYPEDLAPYKDYLSQFPTPRRLISEWLLKVASKTPVGDRFVDSQTERRGARMMDIMIDPKNDQLKLRLTTCDVRLAEVQREIELRKAA